MIIGANPRGNGGQLAAYLLNQGKNERAELMEMRGFADAGSLKSALNGIELEAMQTHGAKPFYHCWFRLDEGEALTAEQWQQSFASVERRLRLEEQARVVVEHRLKGESHYHVVWSLVDRERGRMIELPFDGMRRAEVARDLEQAFGLRKLAPAHEPEQERLRREEWQQAERTERDVEDVRDAKAAIRAAWERSDSGAAFCAALDEQRLMLAIGDSARQPFGVVDEQGQFHVLTRTLDAKVKEVRGKLADLDREQVPSVEEAHARLQQREAERDRETEEGRPAGAALQKEAEAREPERAGREEPTRGEDSTRPAARPDEDRAETGDVAPVLALEPEPELSLACVPVERDADRPAASEAGGGLRVVDQATGLVSAVSAVAGETLGGLAALAGTAIEGIADGFAGLLGGGSTARREPDREPRPEPPRAPKSLLEALQERAARERALRNISQSVQRGGDLNAADLRALPPAELERLRDGGDEYLMRLVRQFEREREERDWGRERER